MIKQACGAALLLCPLLAGAADGDASAWQFGGGFGVTMGGDELGTVHVFHNGELAQSALAAVKPAAAMANSTRVESSRPRKPDSGIMITSAIR